MGNDTKQIRRWRVGGRVQGVGFRASTRQEALSLGIADGWARNLADGDVDVCAAGSADALEQLRGWLQRGPRFARVDRVEELPPPSEWPAGFGT